MKARTIIFGILSVLMILAFMDSVAAGITLMNLETSPSANQWTNGTNNTIAFYYNFTSNATSTGNCTLYLNGVTYGSSPNGTNVAVNTTGEWILANNTVPEGNITWQVNCSDNENLSGSVVRQLYVLRTAPAIVINFPANGAWTTDTTPSINYTVTQQVWTGGQPIIKNCTLYVSGSNKGSNTSLSNNTATYITASTVSEYNNSIQVNCSTMSDVWNGSIVRYLHVDNTACTLAISSPTNQQLLQVAPTTGYNDQYSLTTTATVTDNVDNVMNCNLSIDNIFYNNSITASNGTAFSFAQLLTFSQHPITVSCQDGAGNTCSASALVVIQKQTVGAIDYCIEHPEFDLNLLTGECCGMGIWTGKPKYDGLASCIAATPIPGITTTTIQQGTVQNIQNTITSATSNPMFWYVVLFVMCVLGYFIFFHKKENR